MLETLISDITTYLALFGVCAIAGLFIPIPEDIPLLYAGVKIHGGEMDWAPALLVTLAGVQVRDAMAFGIGRLLGDRMLTRPGVLRVLGASRIERTRALAERFGGRAILLGRFLIGLRAPLFVVAGAMGMPALRFFGWNFLGLVVAVPAVVALGEWFGDPLIEGTMWFIRRWRFVAPVLILAFLGRYAWRRARNSDSSS